MAISDLATWQSKASNAWREYTTKASQTALTGRRYSQWLTTPAAGAAPTTAAVPDNTTAGGIQQRNPSTAMRLARFVATSAQPSGQTLVLCDRLSHQGGLSGIVITAQTTNLPTAALTRYTSGVGVMASLDIYTAVGSTSTTAVVSYTNQAGTAGQTSEKFWIGSSNYQTASRSLQIPLAVGDTGFRSVESVTVTATTSTAGAFGVTLWKPLYMWPMTAISNQNYTFDSILSIAALVSQVQTNACLYFQIMGNNGTAAGIWSGQLLFIEE